MKNKKYDELVPPYFYDELFSIKKRYNKNHNIGKYVHDCAHLLKSILSSWNNEHDLLYYNFYGYDYVSERFISLKDYNKNFYKNNNFNKYISNCFDKGLKAIAQGEMLGISRKIVDEKINFVMLSNDQNQLHIFKNYFTSAPTFNLDEYNADFSEGVGYFDTTSDTYNKLAVYDFAKQLKIKAADKPKLLINLRVHKYTFKEKEHANYYIYYLRPRVFHREFIGSLYLVLTEPLPPHYINQLSLFISEVFSETSISRIRRIEKLNITNLINEELHHSWNTYLRGLGSTIRYDIMHLATTGQLQKLEQKKDYLLENINTLIIINDFFVGLIKAGDNLQNINYLSTKFDGCDYTFLLKSEFSIKETLLRICQNFKKYFNADDENYISFISAIDTLISKLNIKKDIQITTNEIAFEIVFMNLIKNALVHSELKNKKIEINFLKMPQSIAIQILNNGLIPKEWLDFINGGIDRAAGVEFSAGIRTIKRIIYLPFLLWKLNAKHMIKKNRTLVILTIPT